MARSDVVARWRAWSPQLLSVLRIVSAFFFIQSGTVKLFAFPLPMPQGVTAPILSQVWIGGVLETFGGALLLLGIFSRPVAFILAGEMAVAYFQFHAPNGFWVVVNQGQASALFCFIFLYISAAGPGPWSLDAMLRRTHGDLR